MYEDGMIGVRVTPQYRKVRVLRTLEFRVQYTTYSVEGGMMLHIRVTEEEARRLAAAYHEALKEPACHSGS